VERLADGAVVARSNDPWNAVARVIYASGADRGGPTDYCLAPPSMKQSDPHDYDARQREWKSHCGSWDLSDLLARAGKEPRRSYASSMRDEFYADTESRPVFLTDLPPADDLAVVALRDAWKPVLEAVRRMER